MRLCLNEGDEWVDLQIDDHFLHVNSSGCDKGVATYFHEIDVKAEEIHISKFTSKMLHVVLVYRSNACQLKFEDIFQSFGPSGVRVLPLAAGCWLLATINGIFFSSLFSPGSSLILPEGVVVGFQI